MKRILIGGQPDTKPLALQLCTINYSISLEPETELNRAIDQTITLGDCDILHGIDIAITSMNLHERSLFIIDPGLAYGPEGVNEIVPKNATIICVIELTRLMPKLNLDNLPFWKLKNICDKKKKHGKWWMRRGQYNVAIHCYRRALSYSHSFVGNYLQKYETKIYYHIADAQMQLQSYEDALISIDLALTRKPHYVEGLLKKAQIQRRMGDLKAALRCLESAKELEPDLEPVLKELDDVKRLIKIKGIKYSVIEILIVGTAIVFYQLGLIPFLC